MTRIIVFLILLFILIGCSHAVTDPISPLCTSDASSTSVEPSATNHMLWGLYQIFINDDHSSCTIAPVRTTSFHLNALKFLEYAPCSNCVSLSKLIQLGNGIIELDVTVHHPFEQPLIYSAFDVKGIIMFPGSLKINSIGSLYEVSPELKPSYISWALRGDWELLNPDGYSFYWSPIFNPDSQWDITHYYPGKFSNGSPTATINGYINYYTDDDRHLFRPGFSITNTYRIQTQPGPMVVGYAVDACWEPPTVNPVNDPITDFPISANAVEPYQFDVNINDGQPVDAPGYICDALCNRIRLWIYQWGGLTAEKVTAFAYHEDQTVNDEKFWPYDCCCGASANWLEEPFNGIGCDGSENCWSGIDYCCIGAPEIPVGWFRTVNFVYWGSGASGEGYHDFAVDVTDFYWADLD